MKGERRSPLRLSCRLALLMLLLPLPAAAAPSLDNLLQLEMRNVVFSRTSEDGILHELSAKTLRLNPEDRRWEMTEVEAVQHGEREVSVKAPSGIYDPATRCLQLSGGLSLKWEQYSVGAPNADLDMPTRRASLAGPVSLTSPEYSMEAESVALDGVSESLEAVKPQLRILKWEEK